MTSRQKQKNKTQNEFGAGGKDHVPPALYPRSAHVECIQKAGMRSKLHMRWMRPVIGNRPILGGMIDPEEIWGLVLHQLQLDLPRASFDTWVRDTEVVDFEKNVLTISARNAYARDWLESRLTSTAESILKGLLSQPVLVKFVRGETAQEDEQETEAEEEAELNIEPVQWLDYDRIVQPHKQVVVKGYLRRLGMEIGPKAIWLYIGFHQAAWRVQRMGKESGQALHSQDVMRFSGLSFGAFWRSLRHKGIRADLQGLVQRLDEPHARSYRRGRDGRPHRRPVRYQVYMTPRLTRADATAIHTHLKELLAQGTSLTDALRQLLSVNEIMDLLLPIEAASVSSHCNTVMDLVRLETDDKATPEVQHLAQELHRRVISSLGDIHIPHYFITRTIQHQNLTPAQAWLITVSRDMSYINARTGERRDLVTFKRGYLEMAELIGSRRYKTIQAWLNPEWISQQRGGNLSRFLMEIKGQDSDTYADLRVDTMPRSFRVLLDEPLDASGRSRLDANGSNMADADGIISWTQMGGLVGANGSNMVDANGTALNTIKHAQNTEMKNTSTTQHAFGEKTAGAVPQFWELEVLLQQNDVHPKVQKELLEVQASVHAFVSWVLYVASPKSGNLSDPLGYALSRLREHPLREARGVFRQFADLPPAELLLLMESTSHSAYALPKQVDHPLAPTWKKTMGSHNLMMTRVQSILFATDGEE